MDGDAPARATATRHRSPAHRALSTARGPQESRAHYGLRAERARRPRARDGPPRRARRHRGTVAPTRIARPRVERRSMGAALGAGGFSDRRGSRTRSRRPPTLAAHPREALDPLLALLDSHGRGIHRPPGTRARDSSQESRCRARLDDDASRFSLHGRMRAAGAVVPGEALVQAIQGGKIGWQALFANMLTGILDHETYARLVWPAGKLARERGLTFLSAQITDVPGQPLTFPMLLAASGVKYLASGPNPERAVPLLPASGTEGTPYPQLYYWEGPDGSRVLHWRAHHYGDGTRFGFDVGPDEMGHRLSDWLLNQPAFLAQNWPYDTALLYGADWQDNAPMKEAIVANVQEFSRRFTWPRIVTGRAEDFFRDVERRYGTKIPVRRGDTGLYWEDGAAST